MVFVYRIYNHIIILTFFRAVSPYGTMGYDYFHVTMYFILAFLSRFGIIGFNAGRYVIPAGNNNNTFLEL